MSIDLILRNATTEQLGLAVQENLFALFRAMTALPNSQLEETGYLSRHLTFPTNPMYKGAWNTQLPAEDTDASAGAVPTPARARDPHVVDVASLLDDVTLLSDDDAARALRAGR